MLGKKKLKEIMVTGNGQSDGLLVGGRSLMARIVTNTSPT